MKNKGIKIGFGIFIFVLSLSLAYTTANYLEHRTTETAFWTTLLAYALVYIVISSLVASVFPVSLGFMGCALILLLHVLIDYYPKLQSLLKLILVGLVLVALYLLSWLEGVRAQKNRQVAVSPAQQ